MSGHRGPIFSVAWSPDGRSLATASADWTIGLWDADAGERRAILEGNINVVLGVSWSPDARTLASASADRVVDLWDPRRETRFHQLEGHSQRIDAVSFSSDGRLLASKGDDVGLWRCDRWGSVSVLLSVQSENWQPCLAFHPSAPRLAALGDDDSVIYLWELDPAVLLDDPSSPPSLQYTNAKVVLVGDSGVGKSGLGMVLSGERFAPTESTHGRHVWTFERAQVATGDGRHEVRETLLWDLAGQPGYRIIHQLHLGEVAVALVVFDARSETDPFAGVRHWNRALAAARKARANAGPPMRKFLVVARADRGGVAVSRDRMEAIRRELGFDGVFETSAKEGWSIAELAEAVRGAIDWDRVLPKVSSNELFQTIKRFLVREKESGRVLSQADDLYRTFLAWRLAPAETAELPEQFAACVGRVEAAGLIRRLSFGGLVLLQPELVDAYASSLVNAAKDEPDGLGCLREEDARTGRFRAPGVGRVRNRETEMLLLIATVEDLLGHEIALREETNDGAHLVFPIQLTREHPDLPDPEGKAVVFDFEGPVLNLYATLAVRLSHSGVFRKKAMWRNAAEYEATADEGMCGIVAREVEEGRGELTLFFDAKAGAAARRQFEDFIAAHLERRALPESIRRRQVVACPACKTTFTELAITRRREKGFAWIDCGCGERIELAAREAASEEARRSEVREMNRAADARRDVETAATAYAGKVATGDFDVFLCHNDRDKAEVLRVAEMLKERWIHAWLDREQLQPGLPFQDAIEDQLGRVRAAAVFVGKNGFGSWQDMEQKALIQRFVGKKKAPVIPVILPDAKKTPELPLFLGGNTWIDMRKPDPDPIEQLVWGITGKREGAFV